MSQVFKVLIIGGKGNIGSGLRTYLPRLDKRYQFVSVDLAGAEDKATEKDVPGQLIDLDIMAEKEKFKNLVCGKNLVIYLARKSPLDEMNRMTDYVFETVLAQEIPPMILAASSVHAVDDAYHFLQHGAYAQIADRQFDEIEFWPEPIPATLPACPLNDYGHEKAYVESWCKQLAKNGISAIAARWGGINARNSAIADEPGYFTVWCHQQDAARFVHSCFVSHLICQLPSGAHYFVISNNTYGIFDIETPKREVGYEPMHNAESFYAP